MSSSGSSSSKRPYDGEDSSSNKKPFFTVLGGSSSSDNNSVDETSFPSTDFHSLTKLLSWFNHNDFQGLEHLEFKASSTSGGSLGCFAKKDFSVGELLFVVPQKSILGVGHVQQSPLVKFIYNEANKRKCLSKISVELLVWLCMIDEQRDNQHFQVYMQSLAKYSPSLLNWDPNLLALLDQTNLGTTVKVLEGKLNEYAELLREMRRWNKPESEQLLPVERFNFNSLVWACGHYLSRRYPGQYGASVVPSDATVDLSKFSREADMGNVGAMVPLLDILNHSHEQEWLKFEVKEGALHVLCNFPIKAGEELLSNYGDLSNEQLLFAYGYALPSNPNDCFFIKLKLPVGPAEPASKKKKQQAPVQTESRVFSIKAGGWEGIPKDIFPALAKLTQAADSSYQLSANEMGFNEEECNILLDYLMANICKMGVNHVNRSVKLMKFGVDLQMKFPTDKDGEEEDDEVVLDEHTLLPEASVSVISKTNASVGNVERAKFLAYYFLGQYQILIEAAHDLQTMLGDVNDEEGEEEEGDDDDDDDEDEA